MTVPIIEQCGLHWPTPLERVAHRCDRAGGHTDAHRCRCGQVRENTGSHVRFVVAQHDYRDDWFVFPEDHRAEFEQWDGADPWPAWVRLVPGYPGALLTFTNPLIKEQERNRIMGHARDTDDADARRILAEARAEREAQEEAERKAREKDNDK